MNLPHSTILTNLFLKLLIACLCFSSSKAFGQNTTYTPLFTSSTFTKTVNVALPVGTIEASANVANGAASYTIPIMLPPGTNGVVPSIAVSYNSMGGNGILGQGWGLSGISTISRVGQNIYFDGAIKAVDLTSEDRFALDGARLILKSGTHANNLATYGTEVENFSTITSYCAVAGKPDYFKVETKEGVIYEYGNTADSKFMGVGNSAVLFWRLNRVLYKDGNYIDYKYITINNESLLSEIRYTGNTIVPRLAYNLVKFNYLLRNDKNIVFEAGTIIKSEHLLDNITISMEGLYCKKYYFKYAHNNVNSFLKEVEEEGSDNKKLNSTIFKYGDQPSSLGVLNTAVTDNSVSDYFSAELDHDGYSEIIQAPFTIASNGTKVYSSVNVLKRSHSNATYTQVYSSPISGYKANLAHRNATWILRSPKGLTISDFNGDGFDDILVFKTNTTPDGEDFFELTVKKSNGLGTNFVDMNISAPSVSGSSKRHINPDGRSFQLGDFNGDGYIDVLFLNIINLTNAWVQKAYVLYGSSESYGPNFVWHETISIPVNSSIQNHVHKWAEDAEKVEVLDFDGDGKSDILVTDENTTEIFSFNTGQPNQVGRIYNGSFPTKNHLCFMGDFNGDGKIDILARNHLTSNNTTWTINHSDGKVFISNPFVFNSTSSHPIPQITPGRDKIIISDYNGDGRSDIYNSWDLWPSGASSPTNRTIDIYYSKGNSFNFVSSSYGIPLVYNFEVAGDYNGDGRADNLSMKVVNGVQQLVVGCLNPNGKELLLEKVKNGMDHDIEFNYKRMSEGISIYTKGATLTYPLTTLQVPMNLVSALKIENGIPGLFSTTNYSYTGAYFHKQGKGFLGFGSISTHNLTTDYLVTQENELNTTFFAMMPKRTNTYLNTGLQLFNIVTNTNEFKNQGSKRFWPRVNSTIENKSLEGQVNTSTMTYDAYGNVLTSLSNINNVETLETINEYVGNFGLPMPCRPTKTTINKGNNTGTPYTTISTYDYYAIPGKEGKLKTQIDFVSKPKSVTTEYEYDSFGNVNKTTLKTTNANIANNLVLDNRVTSYVYDYNGRLPTSKKNSLNQTETITYDYKWGKPKTVTGIDNLTTTYDYDGFGRRKTTSPPAVTAYTIVESYGWDINATERTMTFKLVEHPGKPNVKIWFDILNRPVKSVTEGFQGQDIIEKTTYDEKGNIASKTAPYKTGENNLITEFTYDKYSRVISSVSLQGTTTVNYLYADGKLSTHTIDPVGILTSKVTDAAGKIVSATDYGGTLTYTYYQHGKLKNVMQGSTVLITNEYDEYLRQSKLIDINAGTTLYEYDAFGQIYKETNANGQLTTIAHDILGRIKTKQVAEGNYTYDYHLSGTGAKVNKLKKITGVGNSVINGVVEEYDYDSYGRPFTLKETIDGTLHTTTLEYNNYNDVRRTTYPSGFIVNAHYDGNGYLQTLKNGTDAIIMFTNTGMDGLGHYKSYTLGNGKTSTNTYENGIAKRYFTSGIQDLNMVWDYPSGNLLSRNDAINNKSEFFSYDLLNRLTGIGAASGVVNNAIQYANNGNIGMKYDVGNYQYDAAKINAVKNVKNTGGNIPILQQDISFTSFFQPSLITESTNKVDFVYGEDGERRKMAIKVNGITTESRYYFGAYEKQVVVGSTVKHLHYISAGEGLIAVVVRDGSTNQDTYNYVYTDHLGSILTVTNSAGIITARQNFDAWGRRRNATTWTYTSLEALPSWLYRGYTGHEHLPQFGLINMNGRLYDPILGRMLSPDNNVQMPDFTQNYNRYSYVLNNPLKYNDPSGEVIPLLIGAAIIGGVANIGVGLLTGQVNNVGDALYYGFTGALVGVASAATGGAALAASGYSGATMIGGAISGAVGGAVGGGLQGATNAIYQKAVYGKHVEPAKEFLKGAVFGAIIGGVIGGAIGGIRARWSKPSGTEKVIEEVAKNKGTITAEQGFGEFPDGTLVSTSEIGNALDDATYRVSTTSLREVGSVLESIDDVMANPNLLSGKSPLQVEGILGKTPGWRVETLGQGSKAGKGWVLRHYNLRGNATGPQIRWHPGGGHKGLLPYWRVVGPNGDLGGVIR